MWIEVDVDGNGTKFLNLNRVTMVVINKDDNSMIAYESLNGVSDNRLFKGINANALIEQLRDTGKGGENN